jgi:DNA replication protein DnaC
MDLFFKVIDDLLIVNHRKTLAEFMKKLLKKELLIIDEMGFLSLKPEHYSLSFQLINEFYEYRSIVLKSDKLFNEWGTTFGDQVITSAIPDRLLHHAEPVIMAGDSYKMNDNLE